MAALPPVVGVARVAVSGTNHDQPWANVFHVKIGTGFAMSSAGVTTFATAFANAYTTALYPIMSQQCGARECTVIQLESDTAPSASVAVTGAGAVTGDIAPLSTAKLLKWNISRRYRGGHPRTYLSGVPENDLAADGRLYLPGAVTGTQNAASNFLSAVNALTAEGEDISLCTVHYVKNNAVLATPLVDDILSVIAQPEIATQRRRLQRA